MFNKKIKNCLLVFVWVLLAIILASFFAIAGYKISGMDSPFYIIGLIFVLILGFLGWLVTLISEIVAFINIVKTLRIHAPLPKRYLFFWGVEAVVTVLWFLASAFAIQGSMSV